MLDIEKFASKILKLQSFEYTSFKEAKCLLSIYDKHYCFDRLSLCVYYHNFDSVEYSKLCHMLSLKANNHFSREDQKARQEYASLFHMIVLHHFYHDAKIIKQTRPDFVLIDKHKVGIEITEFTTPEDMILRAITRENFKKGKTTSEIRLSAIQKHGKKASEYNYWNVGSSSVVGRKVFNVKEQHDFYADIIIKKYTLYHNSFELYDEFVVLCDAQNAPCLSSEDDSKDILSYAKLKCPTLGGFILNILRVDNLGKCVIDSFDLRSNS